ncbi:MAG: glycosyltransferase family 39 protein [Bacteroidales bacterium]|jgi:hypothetical protein|nr:glycosyltransferase family 39 protein [Bacteroidales bacterium]
MKYIKNIPVPVALLMAAGVALSLAQFLFNRSFYWDEAALALNIIHRDAGELLNPLDYIQVAPVLFLQIEKLFSLILPNSEYGLRLFPLLCFWASIWLFYQVIRKLLDRNFISAPHVIVVALSLFVFSQAFVYYSSEVKQYMTDVFVALCMFYLVIKDYRKERTRYWMSGIMGAVFIFLSNVAPVILFTCGLYLMYVHFLVNRKKNVLPFLAVFSAWLGVFAVYYCLFIHGNPTRDVMVRFWSDRHAFLPPNPLEKDFYVFLANETARFFVALYDFKIHAVRTVWRLFFGAFFLSGIVFLIRDRHIKIMILALTPVLLHLLLTALQLYPFQKRFVLYALPGAIIIFSYGFNGIVRFVASVLKSEQFGRLAAIACILLSCCCFVMSGFPFTRFEEREAINYVRKNIKDTESFYVSFYYATSVKYYADIGLIPPDMNISNRWLSNEDIEFWMMKDIDLRAQLMLNDMKTLRGKNWLLLDKTVNAACIIDKLDSLGYKRLDEFKTQGTTSVYLYDFGE